MLNGMLAFLRLPSLRNLSPKEAEAAAVGSPALLCLWGKSKGLPRMMPIGFQRGGNPKGRASHYLGLCLGDGCHGGVK